MFCVVRLEYWPKTLHGRDACSAKAGLGWTRPKFVDASLDKLPLYEYLASIVEKLGNSSACFCLAGYSDASATSNNKTGAFSIS
jgi:hypothetical protein